MIKSRVPKLSGVFLFLFLAGCVAMSPDHVKTLSDTVIDADEVWSGTIVVDGVVTVKKEGKLTIRPGTKVLFVRNDRDGDGIGDAEILIEGSLVARGTPGAPILFSSAEENRQPADWKYLYLDFARQGEVAYVVSEYAYSGIQVHFCKAVVENSVFRNNIDGVRFSTVNIEVRGNRIYRNRHGLRYEERRSRAIVTGNDIRNNDIGVFIVTRSEDKAQIWKNNIADNRDYNVKLGISQKHDVTLPQNWWGVAPNKIEDQFFDKKQDRTLGRVRAPEPLTAPVSLGLSIGMAKE
ncbi:MAG: hypothetical protein C0623_02545 [Desulfuromonas sp.]|nr:MAG: hypothetical protein C0623_02545 [Desulfuromonas sp.]